MDFRVVQRTASRQGWEITRRGKHLMWVSPVTGRKVFTSATPSDRRAVANIIRDLKREGYNPGT